MHYNYAVDSICAGSYDVGFPHLRRGDGLDRSIERAIEWDCTQLLYEFYACLDEKRYDDLVELFAEDGVWVRLGEEVPKKTMKQVMGVRESWITAHLVSNARIRVKDENSAESTQFVTLYRHEDWNPADGPAPVVQPLGILRHKDQMVRVGDRWKFKRKTSRAVMANRERVTHYDKERKR
jgi:hypothetical protein